MTNSNSVQNVFVETNHTVNVIRDATIGAVDAATRYTTCVDICEDVEVTTIDIVDEVTFDVIQSSLLPLTRKAIQSSTTPTIEVK